jgi:superfamily II DNA or RNA helicase
MALELYDYQTGILELLRQGFAQGHKHQILVAPTGAGKTEMAIALLEACSDKGNRAAMILDRIVLCDQTSQRLQKYNIAHGVMQSGHWRNRAYERIQICSAQTIEKRGSFPGLKLMIVDEAHQTRKQTMEFIKNNPDVFVVGLTATPFTRASEDWPSSSIARVRCQGNRHDRREEGGGGVGAG